MFLILDMHQTNIAELDLNLLVALDALLGEESVTRAAKRVGITQPAMSHALARLRDALGDPLLVRGARGMVPTARARSLAQPLSRALADLRAVVATGSAFDPAVARRAFTIATADYGTMVLVPALMARIAREAPGIEVVVRPFPDEVVQALEDERIDVALSPYPEPRAALVGQRLFTERFVCVVRLGHPAAKKRFDLDAYCAASHVQIAPRGTRGGAVDDLLARQRRSRHVALRIADFLVAPLVVLETDLVLTLPARIAALYAETHPLVVLDTPFSRMSFTMWQTWLARRREEPAHTWFRNLVAAVAKDR